MATTEFDSAQHQQRLSALERGNANRFERLQWRREIKSMALEDGCHRVADLLIAPPRALGSAKIGDILLWPKGIHRRRVLHWMTSAGCRDSLKVEKLTDRQRALLIDSLRG